MFLKINISRNIIASNKMCLNRLR
uniref:Uncharacterized protein n=1 Tax=Ciona intestinalis TaxID=7719 RepID=H2XJY2_CIOIN